MPFKLEDYLSARFDDIAFSPSTEYQMAMAHGIIRESYDASRKRYNETVHYIVHIMIDSKKGENTNATRISTQ